MLTDEERVELTTLRKEMRSRQNFGMPTSDIMPRIRELSLKEDYYDAYFHMKKLKMNLK